MPSAHQLITDAGHRPATRNDARSVLALAADTQRRSPVALLGSGTRYLPRPLARSLALFVTWLYLACGDLAYDPGRRAALSVGAPGERRLRRSAIWCLAAVPVCAVQAVAFPFLPGPARLLSPSPS